MGWRYLLVRSSEEGSREKMLARSSNLFLIHINITWRQQIAKQIITEGNTVNVKRAGNTR